MNTLYHSIIQLAHVPFLSQAASRVGESSDDFSQRATAAVPHSVETTVISELVVTSTLRLPGDIENIIRQTQSCLLFYNIYISLSSICIHLSKGYFSTIEQSAHDEGTKGPVVGATFFPDSTSTQSVEYKTTGMWLLF